MQDYLVSYMYTRNGYRRTAMEVISGDYRTAAIAKFIDRTAELNQTAMQRDRDGELAILSVIELDGRVGAVTEALEKYDET